MAEVKRFEKGEVIFRAGDFEFDLYEIKSGLVGIYADYATETENKLVELAPGKFFGEMALVEVRPRSATAVALEDTEAICVSCQEFGSYYAEDGEKVYEIFKNLTGRLRDLSDDYLSACQAIAEYVAAQEAAMPRKKGLLDRIKALVSKGESLMAKEV